MARFEYVGISRVGRNLGTRVAQAIRSSGVLDEVAKDLIKDIQGSKRGSGTNTKTGRNFAGLKQSTIDRRKRLATVNRTDPAYSSDKSNLTFTGQLVRSIKARINRTKALVIIEPSGKRKAYRGIRKNKLKRTVLTNKELAEKHAAGEGNLPKRDILSFSKRRQKEIVDKISRAIRKRLRQ